uniref:Uncharacterized protein n=1 Tax=Tanacetum cinerariifolium TaxID=118510 RepID=A0A6L2JN98_TANCI|nr:hypothetical protein [Tanacetum cinerariifolium]
MDLLGAILAYLKEDGSKYRLIFVLDRKELTMTLHDFRTIFQLHQATDNNHERFVVAPKFLKMAPFFLNDLGFTLELRSPSNFKTTGLVQPWIAKWQWWGWNKLMGCEFIVSCSCRNALLTRTSINTNSLSQIHKARCKNKAGVGIKILSWMITDEMKLTENYRMYAKDFGVDVPTTQSQSIESTQGMHRKTSASRSPNLSVDEGESKKVNEHLLAEEIEKMEEGTENEDIDEPVSCIPNSQNDSDTRLDPRSYKESSEVETTVDVQPVNVVKEDKDLA